MWNLSDINPPESEAVQAEREIVEAVVANERPRPTRTITLPSCDRCGRKAELYHNETTGLALCESCDALQDRLDAGVADSAYVRDEEPVVQIAPCRFKRLHAGGWGIIGPAEAVVTGQAVTVEKRDGTHDVVTVGKVLWTGNGQSIARINRSPRAARPDRGGAFNNRARS